MRIRVAASALGWSATDLYHAVKDRLGIKYPSIRDIVNGVRKDEVPPSWLKAIADVTYQSFEWLSGFDGAQFREPTQTQIAEAKAIAEANRAKGLSRHSFLGAISQPLPELVAA